MSAVDMATGEIVSTINYRIHPVADLFPFIEGAAFREFVEDIRANGQREPVVLDSEGRLLDGRNRARACQALGIDVKETRYSGDDAEAWIISHNVHRRHLTTSQRAMIAGRLADMRRGERTDIVQNQTKSTSLAEAAAKLDVSRAIAASAKSVIASGDADLIKKVEAGEITVNKAAEEVRSKKVAPEAAAQPSTTDRNWVPAAVRAKQISDLAKLGATSAQIGKEIGLSEQRVREVARAQGVVIPGDVVTRNTRRIDHDRVLDNVTESLAVSAMSLRDIDPASLDSETAVERLDSLTASINALSKAVKKIKESLHV